ncbi:MAG: ParB/RepB/Spo0J family partition protein [Deltaproteobacteria bacterium]|nr:ParB/RepB/Spo0J family partition protein [Deltaproteobacteria bacterium]
MEPDKKTQGSPLMISVHKILPNPDQPRKFYKKTEITKLADSIKSSGIIEPLVVRHLEGKDSYQLIVGHRRLLAAKEAGEKEVPAVIRQIPDEPKLRLELAMMENIFRENLNPIEEGEGYHRLELELGLDILEIAKMFGKDRSTIANTIRLLELPEPIKDDIRYNRLSAGHGRAILSLNEPKDMLEARSLILSQAMSVRDAEKLTKKINTGKKHKSMKGLNKKAYYEALGSSFSDSLGGLKVKIKYNGQKKRIDIYYASNDDVDMLKSKLNIY